MRFKPGHLVLAVSITAATAGFWSNRSINTAELTLIDISQELRGPRQVPRQVAIIAIDDYSLQQTANGDLSHEETINRLQTWPWPRSTYKLVLKRLFESGARAVAFDLLLDTPSSYGPSDDKEFSDGLRDYSDRIVLGSQVLETSGSVAGLSLLRPIPTLLNSLNPNSEGLLNGLSDPDGSIRKRPSEYAFTVRPVLQSELPKSLSEAILEKTHSKIKKTRSNKGWDTLIDLYGPPRSITTIPIWEILETRSFENLRNSRILQGKTIFIGPTASVMQDRHRTAFGGTEGMAGVEIHATEFANRLEGREIDLQPQSIWGWIGVGIGTFFIGLLSLRWKRPLARIGVTAAFAGGLVVISVLGVMHGGVGIRVLGLTAGVISVGVATSAQATVQLQLNRRRLKRSLSRYLSPAVASEIANQPEEADGLLGGKLTEVVVLMTDIRGFTAYTQAMSSSGRVVELVERLNVYFSEVVEALHGQGATVDKFIGDATLAVFGAPIHRGNQAEASAAIEAALEIETRLQNLNQTWEQQGEPSWQQVIVLSFGTVISGNIGSSRRMDYTVIGDAVNTASRLEAVAKQCQRTIVMSQGVADLVRDQWPLEDLGRFEIRGQTAQHVYALASVTNPVPKAADRS